MQAEERAGAKGGSDPCLLCTWLTSVPLCGWRRARSLDRDPGTLWSLRRVSSRRDPVGFVQLRNTLGQSGGWDEFEVKEAVSVWKCGMRGAWPEDQ